MTETDIQPVDAPRWLTWHPRRVPSNAVAFEKDGYSLTNPLIVYRPHRFHTFTKLQAVINAYRDRVKVLRSEGELEEITLNTASEEDFYCFIKSAPSTRRASLVLLDNGNLRAVWSGKDGSHVGIQFRGDQSASFVIFASRPSKSGVSRVSGKDTLDGLKSHIEVFGLDALLNPW